MTTLTELFHTLVQESAIPPSRLKDLKTSMRYLAKAMGTMPEAITAEEAVGRYRERLNTYFAKLDPVPSPHTIRNTLNNLSFLFRTAHKLGHLTTVHAKPMRVTRIEAIRLANATSPYRLRIGGNLPRILRPIDSWPADIRDHWMPYQAKRQFELRPVTHTKYDLMFATYVSYGLGVEQPSVTTWAELFDPQFLQRFIQWHAKRVNAHRISPRGWHTARMVSMIARHEHRPEFPALQTFIKKLPKPEAMHDKQHPDHSITLRELEDVALTLREESRRPLTGHSLGRHPGAHRASSNQAALILRLWVRVPLRSRNIREMQLGKHLYQDGQGIWHLRFQGDDLKIRERQGRINKFHIPFPPDLVEHLEEFLQRHRPILPNSDRETHVFLTLKGNKFTTPGHFSSCFKALIFARLGKRFYPHLIRTIWTDTCLLMTHDISTTAFMLNDRPETVLARYHELRANDHIPKAYQFTSTLLGGGIV